MLIIIFTSSLTKYMTYFPKKNSVKNCVNSVECSEWTLKRLLCVKIETNTTAKQVDTRDTHHFFCFFDQKIPTTFESKKNVILKKEQMIQQH